MTKPLGGHPLTADGVEAHLWDNPGLSTDDLRRGMTNEQIRRLSGVLREMIYDARVTGVRFTLNAPHLHTTTRYFPTAKGQIEVVAADSMSMAYVHDPLGTWAKAMAEAD